MHQGPNAIFGNSKIQIEMKAAWEDMRMKGLVCLGGYAM